MMEIIPAIDLYNGSCVRLVEGDYQQKTEYPGDPVEQALAFQALGVKRLHVVDLEGAQKGQPVHTDTLSRICQATSMKIDFGGGIRTANQVEELLKAGAYQISLGSIAVQNPSLVAQWIGHFGPDRFFLGADVLDGFIATQAWTKKTALPVEEFIQGWKEQGIENFFSTDVRKDGRLEGPALDLYRQLLESFPDIRLVASGGVASVSDLEELSLTGVAGVIIGKALYENRITMDELKPWIKDVS